MTRRGSFAFVSAVAVVFSTAVTSGARQGTADGSVRLTVGPMRLLSPRFGYAVAYRTVRRGATAQTTIGLFVDNEGRWRNATPPRLKADGIDAIDDVAFVDQRHGWIAAYNCARATVYLYRTTDGGRSWRPLGRPTGHSCGGGPTFLSFVDAGHGWMEPVSPNAPGGELLQTADGGKTWRHVAFGPPGQVSEPALPCLAPIRFVSRSRGWMGRCQLGGVFSTADGGHRWRRARIAIPSRRDARLDLPWFHGTDGVLAATIGTRPLNESGRTQAVVFSATHDGGRDWTVRSIRRVGSCPLNAYFTNVWPASVADRRVWWLVADGSRPRAQVTTDAGRTWRTTVAHGLPTRWCSVVSVSAGGPKTAWVIARENKESNALFRTIDAGRSWRRVTLLGR